MPWNVAMLTDIDLDRPRLPQLGQRLDHIGGHQRCRTGAVLHHDDRLLRPLRHRHTARSEAGRSSGSLEGACEEVESICHVGPRNMRFMKEGGHFRSFSEPDLLAGGSGDLSLQLHPPLRLLLGP